MGSSGRRRWPASPASGLLVLGLGLDDKSLSKERNWSLRFFFFLLLFFFFSPLIHMEKDSSAELQTHKPPMEMSL